MQQVDDLTQHRLNKLAKLRQRGIDPYPPRFHRALTSDRAIALFTEQESAGATAASPEAGEDVTLAGRIVSSRGMGKVSFAHILDGEGKIQIFLRKDVLGEELYEDFKLFDLGDFIGVKGKLFRTRAGEITLEVHDFRMLSKSLHPLPEKWHGLVDVEKRYRQRYLDLISNPEVRDIFLTRSKAIASIRRLMENRGFIEVETPILHDMAGGAAAKPFITYHNALDQTRFLRVATELHLKRLIIGGFEKVYEIGRVFRNEGISTKHNPEYTLMESYEAYADYNDVMQMVEEIVSTVAQEVKGTMIVSFGGQDIDLTPPWRRLTIRDAIIKYGGVDFTAYADVSSLRDKMESMGMTVDPALGRGKLIDELLSQFVEPNLIQPTFVLDYPIELSPLAKKKPDDPTLVERFEPFIGGMEVGNAYTELNDPIDQRERFVGQLAQQESGDEETELVDEDFLVALEHGMPPTGGLGIGIDRLVMILTGQQSIREVILFPQLRTKE
ncbi:MAG: lysine--tRNA ligase [Dehalococcoidia bacterium]|nr:lysine--tRNA ligase [Dehalococcoidia bacterium]